jgi:hypothetical protein
MVGAPERRPSDDLRAPAEAVIRVDHLYKEYSRFANLEKRR